ncbi:hypothetical protein JCM18899A_53260 [Nocardioides sp. AN3]
MTWKWLSDVVVGSGRGWWPAICRHTASDLHLAHSSLWGRATTFASDGQVRKKGYGFREARRIAGREDLTIHDLRHTAASMAGEEGASLAELMHRLGHSTPSMALLYQHSTKARDLAIARRLSERMKDAGGAGRGT